MFKNAWQRFLDRVSNDDLQSARRRFPRRTSDICILEIGGKQYPIHDWSMGGVMIEADSRTFQNDQDITFQLKFKLRESLMQIKHTARVVRKSKNYVALEFDPLPGDAKDAMTRVIEDSTSRLSA